MKEEIKFGEILKVKTDGLEYVIEDNHENPFYKIYDKVNMIPVSQTYWIGPSDDKEEYLKKELSPIYMNEHDEELFKKSSDKNKAYIILDTREYDDITLGNNYPLYYHKIRLFLIKQD